MYNGSSNTPERAMKITSLKAHFAPRTVSRIKARLAILGHIHAAKFQLGLSDSAYRAMVSTASKNTSESAADLDFRGRQRLLNAMAKAGYVEAEPTARSVALRQRRLADLGVIHVAARALGLQDADYRSLVVEASRGKTRTSADLNAKERSLLVASMRRQGFSMEAATA